MRARLSVPVSLILSSLLFFSAALAWAGKAERVNHSGVEFVVYWVDLQTDELWLCWQDAKGKALESFSRLREHLTSPSRELKFAINGGIFSRDKRPMGLHIEGGKELRPLNLGNLEGGQYNFYLKPNGVFYVVSNRLGIVESSQFAERQVRPSLACQSGPLLLNQGAIHPVFRPGSTNLHWRSGVGVTKDNQAVFVLSKQVLCFHDFARLFKEKLGCDHALYLDGDICAVYLPELGHKEDARSSFAAMFAVTAKPGPAAPPPGVK